ncbi:Oxidoreductase andH [Hyphodiscus hymeniophilus]|uniref:Oxidoreductase andH n=1 Tax=Hyphodiscus hymeniophilus TaxID=353542 RepID=A0A9P7AW70_9HELO|nr:Oxidoreductase andH [Hyphodiscus hymeniophilus]
MVNIKDVRISNASLRESKNSLTAVFVGGTSGIGMGTLKQFAKNVHAPKVYIVGRSKKAAQSLLDELSSSNPQGTFVFLETEIGLMKNVDKVCEDIKTREKKIDLLFMSPGYLSFEGRNGEKTLNSPGNFANSMLETSEGIDLSLSIRYYARLRFTYNLLPLLTESPSPRVVAILAGGQEAEIDFNDLEMKNNFNGFKAAANGATQHTLAFEELANSYPTVTFIHNYPGIVATGVVDKLMTSATGIWAIPATIARWLIVPIISLFAARVDVAGERGLFLATSARYPPAQPKTDLSGVALPKGVEVSKASIVMDGKGNGVYLLNESDESGPDAPIMPKYRAEGKSKVVWESTVWERALERA